MMIIPSYFNKMRKCAGHSSQKTDIKPVYKQKSSHSLYCWFTRAEYKNIQASPPLF